MSKKKWVVGALVLAGASAYGSYEYFRFSIGYYSLPENVPDTASIHAFKGGLRAIYINSPMEIVTNARKVIGVSEQLPEWYHGAWSYCSTPDSEIDIDQLGIKIKPGMRFEALCYIEAEGDEPLFSGVLFSVPNL